MASDAQDITHIESLNDPNEFWTRQAKQLTWHKAPTTALRMTRKQLKCGNSHASWTWFPDGKISTSYNCVDRHVDAGNGDKTAIIWDSPVSRSKQKITYAELQEEVAIMAGVLREEGVQKGDVVVIYMPMIPAALIGILATIRLGAIHAVVFGGFSSTSLAQRIEASHPKAILTASCGIEGVKGPLPYQTLVQAAIAQCDFKPQRTIIWQRAESSWDDICEVDGERSWQCLVQNAKGPGDVMFAASDIGWALGHSYILYAPLLAGATTVLFEGKPVGTPDAGTFWRIVEEYRVTSMFMAPTALRAIRQADPQNSLFKARGVVGGLKHLRALFLAGERSEPSLINMYTELLATYCAPGASVIDNWWSTESGSPITGIPLMPAAGMFYELESTKIPSKTIPIKPGSAGKPAPGFDVRIVDDAGNELPRGSMGNIVLGLPLGPTGLTTLWQDEVSFYHSYLERFNGQWMDTGDAGIIDSDGYVHVMCRNDDFIKVAAHRLSTGAMEQSISSHPAITEACVVPLLDHIKGHVPIAFIAIERHSTTPPDLLEDLNQRLRLSIGPIAKLGGYIASPGIIPKTRSGKMLRRVLREILENATAGEFEKEIDVPATVEDSGAVGKAKMAVREFFIMEENSKLHSNGFLVQEESAKQ
ncbi:acetyl-coenzyme A synthetase [Pyrenophora tritici-repentis Pt-1C-BFP]|uniref:Acetyl-coenzyme A synthetase n=1 Tax=Pyrenophora tritici-repentis (strain Pt-1C-BFP) TaxID=426418 RepID=B2WPB7_PYRTR|nr:acetyl-coenzyme A synthetase [Pyrenophora tritici-repentis Pt-1C-BFP]EDU45983.1 acetyl-coenzyme A synthetase [Pyrenophora tritici-repentis Pt-1C-BFP]